MCFLRPVFLLLLSVLLGSCDLGGDIQDFVEDGTDTISLSFDPNGGSGDVESITYYKGLCPQTVTVTDGSLFSRTWYRFNGWNTEADGSGKDYAAGATFTIETADSTLFAQWSPIILLAGCSAYSLLAVGGGDLWAWGLNTNGLLGLGTTTTQTTPTAVTALTGVIDIDGYLHSLALTGGSVYAWGQNTYGQLGLGTTTTQTTPTLVPALASGVAAVSAGYLHNLALTTGGAVYAWGYNAYGQLGDASTTSRTTPTLVSTLASDVVAISAGYSHSMALTAEGAVYAWGLNTSGQLGDGTTTTRTSPVQVPGLTDVVAIAAGSHFCLAVKRDGTVWAWGQNNYGQLGDGTTTNRTSPGRVGIEF